MTRGDLVSTWLFDPDGALLEGPDGPVSHLVCGGVYDQSTGQVGIEALSRGATEVVFVERGGAEAATLPIRLSATHPLPDLLSTRLSAVPTLLSLCPESPTTSRRGAQTSEDRKDQDHRTSALARVPRHRGTVY
jgi:hypothetical protein